eukprot:m.618515 g.618515  ORF g.618515 m.618515 type:complete len:355 (+) comp22529_c1_seq1:142-1206(+)
MTTLTGSTEQKLKGTVEPPGFTLAILGAIAQMGVLGYAWTLSGTVNDAIVDAGAHQCISNDRSHAGCTDWFRTNPWAGAIALQLLLGLFIFAKSVILRADDGAPDPSIVDKLWSITPFLNVWLCHWSTITSSHPFGNGRTLVMGLLTTTWGIRLTWNFWRKGGYESGAEDYRWVEVRKWMPGWQFEVFNPIFICTFQPLLLLALAAPAALATEHPDVPLGPLDFVATVLFAVLLAGETIADIQMFNYQTEKYRRKAAGLPAGPYARGFIETGLWGWSRHPNYFCEVHIWFAFYLFSVAASGLWLNWTLSGAVLLFLLFVPPAASLDVTESLSSRKYEAYSEYQAKVPRFYPVFL